MAHAASFHKMMQVLRGINNEMDKFEGSSLRIDTKLSSYFGNTESQQETNQDIITFLNAEKVVLSETKQYHQHNTPNARFSKSKPKYSSKKKLRPTMKRTPLKVSTTTVSNTQNVALNKSETNALDKKIPQKKTLLSLSTKPVKTVKTINTMHIDTDSENDENLAPMNLLCASSNNMVQMKLEQQKQKKQKKQKPKIDALAKAKEKRVQDEMKERERAKQRELKRAQIAENKRKQKLLEQQKIRLQQQQHKNHSKPKKHHNKGKANHCRMVKKMPNIKKIAFKIPQNTSKHKQSIKPSLMKNKVNINDNKQYKQDLTTEYELSDYDSNYSDSDLDEESCGKFIPNWAKKKNPLRAVERQKAIDPDTIFGRMHYKSVDLEVVFKDWPSRTKYRNRSASGDWSRDQISWTEENGYKKSMGWCK